MFYLIALFIILPSLAWAGNVNIPTIVLTERLMGLSFVLIVGLEAFILRRYLQGLGNKKALFISLKSNLITILFVVPLVWGMWLFFIFNPPHFLKGVESIPLMLSNEVVANIFMAPLTLDTHNLLIAEWAMVPVYFIASYYFEYWFSRKKLKDFDSAQVKKAFFYANLYSYLMIMILETIYQFIITPYKATNPYLF